MGLNHITLSISIEAETLWYTTIVEAGLGSHGNFAPNQYGSAGYMLKGFDSSSITEVGDFSALTILSPASIAA